MLWLIKNKRGSHKRIGRCGSDTFAEEVTSQEEEPALSWMRGDWFLRRSRNWGAETGMIPKDGHPRGWSWRWYKYKVNRRQDQSCKQEPKLSTSSLWNLKGLCCSQCYISDTFLTTVWRRALKPWLTESLSLFISFSPHEKKLETQAPLVRRRNHLLTLRGSLSNHQEIILICILLKCRKRKGRENKNVNLSLAKRALGKSWLHEGDSDQGLPGWGDALGS